MKKLFLLIIASVTYAATAQIYESNITVQTFAGSGFYGYLDGVGALTMFYGPASLGADSIRHGMQAAAAGLAAVVAVMLFYYQHLVLQERS